MADSDELTAMFCRKLLRQAAWRLQYKIRTQYSREGSSLLDYQAYDCSFDTDVLSKIYVKQLMEEIPWEKSRYVIQKIILQGKTEKDVARELHITQQAVNKWKKKGLQALIQNLDNS